MDDEIELESEALVGTNVERFWESGISEVVGLIGEDGEELLNSNLILVKQRFKFFPNVLVILIANANATPRNMSKETEIERQMKRKIITEKRVCIYILNYGEI